MRQAARVARPPTTASSIDRPTRVASISAPSPGHRGRRRRAISSPSQQRSSSSPSPTGCRPATGRWSWWPPSVGCAGGSWSGCAAGASTWSAARSRWPSSSWRSTARSRSGRPERRRSLHRHPARRRGRGPGRAPGPLHGQVAGGLRVPEQPGHAPAAQQLQPPRLAAGHPSGRRRGPARPRPAPHRRHPGHCRRRLAARGDGPAGPLHHRGGRALPARHGRPGRGHRPAS
jgi:hypothetical protein